MNYAMGMRQIGCLPGLLLIVLTIIGCSDDVGSPSDNGMDHLATDAPSDGVLPWPDGPVHKDTQPLSCTPEQAGMCNDDKTKYCNSGVCTSCPADHVDCDRKDTCECIGACNGTKCVK